MPNWLGIEFNTSSKLIVWNIGQGQWVTEITDASCKHYDMGGEKSVVRQATELCRNKEQKVFISHWDWDHMAFVGKYAKQNPNICIAAYPVGTSSQRKTQLLQHLKICPEKIFYTGQIQKTSNDQSHVFFSKNILLPGDSTLKIEKIWQAQVPLSTKGLVLGHHGSRSSTGDELLAHLKNLKWAVASAKQSRYGHPHQEVIMRLKKHHVPLLRTEDWGSLVFIE